MLELSLLMLARIINHRRQKLEGLHLIAMPQSKSNSLQFQDRDIALIRGLFESRIMTIEHATALYFNGTGEYAKKRLQKIKAAGFIGERPRRTFDRSVLFLTRKGLALLQERGLLREYPSFSLSTLER